MTLAQLRTAVTRQLARIGELGRRDRIVRELDAEIAFHIDSEIAHHVARGLSPDEARREALRAFGGVQRFREEARAERGFAPFDTIGRDGRLALRRLRRAPTFAVGVALTLAVGFGAASTVGTMVYGVLVKPLPFPEPDQLVRLSLHTPGLGITTPELSGGTYLHFAEGARSFVSIGAYMENEGIAITDGDNPERVSGALLTPALLPMLGARPVAGRVCRAEDALENPVPVMISAALWQRRFGGDVAIEGRFIELNRTPRRIVGVLPTDFEFPSTETSIFYPERVTAGGAGLTDRYLTVVARLAPGATVDQAQREIDALATRLPERYSAVTPEVMRQAGLRATVSPLRRAMVAPVRNELLLLATMVAIVLLIAVANVSTLCLLRAERLRGEIAISHALGAGSAATIRRFVFEGVLMALLGALLALPIVFLAVRARFGFESTQLPRLHEVTFSPWSAIGLVVVAIATGVLLGLVGAARASAGELATTLRDGARSTRGVAWRRTQFGLVTTQIALALSLLLAAGLMGASLVRLHRVNLGFDATNGMTLSVRLPFRPYPTYQRAVDFDYAVMEQLKQAPGVSAVGVAMQFPSTPHLLYEHPRASAYRADGRAVEAIVTSNMVSPSFFEAMRMPMVRGRTFERGDLSAPAPGVVLSAALAQVLFGVEDPVGREVRLVSHRRMPPYRVVGVTGDVYGDRVTDGELPVLYFPILDDITPTAPDTAQVPYLPAGVTFVVRSAAPPSTLAPALKRAVSTIDRQLPVWDVRTLQSIVDASNARTRLAMLLLGVAAAATLLLSAIGLYSVIAYAVAGRGREFAVRLALGAPPRALMLLVLREGAVVALVGIIGGLAATLAGARLIRGLLYEVSATDPMTYAAAALVILLTTTLATWCLRAGRRAPIRRESCAESNALRPPPALVAA